MLHVETGTFPCLMSQPPTYQDRLDKAGEDVDLHAQL